MENSSPDAEVLFVSEEEEGTRLDKLLALRFTRFSRTYFQSLIEDGCVLLNGELAPKRFLPAAGDEIEVCFQATPETSLTPESIPLDIVYEDEFLLAVNKPPGMVVHPAPGHWNGTFVNALLAHCKIDSTHPLRPGIVHRLDKETSGLLLAAKTTETHQKLVAQFAARKMDKLYLAICVGKPPNGLCSAPLGRHPVLRREVAVLPEGKEAITDFQVAAYNGELSLVIAKPKTGRTHQIRVHLKHLGTPVLGDPVYGSEKANRSWNRSRQMLHAYRLSFFHPITGAHVDLVAPLPEEMRELIAALAARPELCGLT